MTQPYCGVVVHLVHGTWPFGLFGRPKQNKKAWFEDGSAVRKGIEGHLACPIEFRVFPWDSRNSFSARRQAAGDFDTYLTNAVNDRPDRAHIIVAHSHGGTVAAHTLASRTQSECRIKALICLATPFAYLASRHDKEEGIFFGAAGYAICLLACIIFSFLVPLPNLIHGLCSSFHCLLHIS